MGAAQGSFKSKTEYFYKAWLGSGGCADVYLYTKYTQGCPSQEVVLKVLKNSDPGLRQELFNEGEVLNSLHHPQIVRSFGYEVLENHKTALVLEYIKGKSLDQLIEFIPKPIRSPVATLLARKIINAIEATHHMGVIHGDISCNNILITDLADVKLTDFGISAKIYSNSSFFSKGNPYYLSLSRWNGGTATVQSDVFSLTMVIYEILLGYSPFEGESHRTIKDRLSEFLKMKEWQLTAPVQWHSFLNKGFNIETQYIGFSRILDLIPKTTNEVDRIAQMRLKDAVLLKYLPQYYSTTQPL